jgi:hypothetical protein
VAPGGQKQTTRHAIQAKLPDSLKRVRGRDFLTAVGNYLTDKPFKIEKSIDERDL